MLPPISEELVTVKEDEPALLLMVPSKFNELIVWEVCKSQVAPLEIIMSVAVLSAPINLKVPFTTFVSPV